MPRKRPTVAPYQFIEHSPIRAHCLDVVKSCPGCNRLRAYTPKRWAASPGMVCNYCARRREWARRRAEQAAAGDSNLIPDAPTTGGRGDGLPGRPHSGSEA